jgi:hypothetical protein
MRERFSGYKRKAIAFASMFTFLKIPNSLNSLVGDDADDHN